MITTSSGATYHPELEDAPTGLVGDLTLRVEDSDGEIVTAASSSGIVEVYDGFYRATRTAPAVEADTFYRLVWEADDVEVDEALLVAVLPAVAAGDAFATVEDVAGRLGRTLTDAQEAQVQSVLNAVAGLIRTEVNHADDWTPAPIPAALSELSIQKAISAVTNPSNLASESEQIGQYSHSQTFPRSADVGVFLSDEEARSVRFAVYGSNTASPRVHGLLRTPGPPYDKTLPI